MAAEGGNWICATHLGDEDYISASGSLLQPSPRHCSQSSLSPPTPTSHISDIFKHILSLFKRLRMYLQHFRMVLGWGGVARSCAAKLKALISEAPDLNFSSRAATTGQEILRSYSNSLTDELPMKFQNFKVTREGRKSLVFLNSCVTSKKFCLIFF